MADCCRLCLKIVSPIPTRPKEAKILLEMFTFIYYHTPYLMNLIFVLTLVVKSFEFNNHLDLNNINYQEFPENCSKNCVRL